MASGKKNYFRHSFTAHSDSKIMDLVEKYGKEAYFNFFVLLELCGEQAADKIPDKFVFHPRTLCNNLLVKRNKLSTHLLHLQDVDLIKVECTDNKVVVLVPNLSKYLGTYTSKIPPNVPNKRKENERKENEIKENEIKENEIKENDHDEFIINEITPASLVDLWNQNFPDMMYKSHDLGSRDHITNFIESAECLNTLKQWQKVFDNAKKSDWLMGRDIKQTAKWFGFLWIIKHDNILKVNSFYYGGRESPGEIDILAGIEAIEEKERLNREENEALAKEFDNDPLFIQMRKDYEAQRI